MVSKPFGSSKIKKTPKGVFFILLYTCARTNAFNRRTAARLLTGTNLTAASGGKKESLFGKNKERGKRERRNATIFLSGRVVGSRGLGEPSLLDFISKRLFFWFYVNSWGQKIIELYKGSCRTKQLPLNFFNKLRILFLNLLKLR